MKTYIGIDPGKSGAIAFIPPIGDPWTIKNTATDQELVDAVEESISMGFGVFATIEKVHAMPGNGVVGMFKFGGSFHSLQMLCTALCVPFELVSPQKWQRSLTCLTGGDKNVTKTKAQNLFPTVKVIHANADALLLAEYGRRLNL
jgi:hypothetical protein